MTTASTRLTKTEQDLLERIALRKAMYDNPSIGVEWFYGVGPEGGRISEGARKYDAAYRLVRRGICKLLGDESFHVGGIQHHIVRIELA